MAQPQQPPQLRCSLCGFEATACWLWGLTELAVCPQCARRALPALYADAVLAGTALGQADVQQALHGMVARFWETVVAKRREPKGAPAVLCDGCRKAIEKDMGEGLRQAARDGAVNLPTPQHWDATGESAGNAGEPT